MRTLVRWMGSGAVVMLALSLAACGGRQDLVSPCIEAGASCPPCSVNDECVVVSNACHETASCTHRDSGLVVTMDGCSDAQAHEVPPDSDCVCQQAVCQAAE